MASDFLATVLKTGKKWSNAFIILKENDYQPRILCQMRVELMPSGARVLSCKFSQKEDARNPNRQQSKIQEDSGSKKQETQHGREAKGISRWTGWEWSF